MLKDCFLQQAEKETVIYESEKQYPNENRQFDYDGVISVRRGGRGFVPNPES